MITAPSNDDQTLRRGIEECSLDPSQFGHREHVRLAWTYLTEHEGDFAMAAARFRDALRRFATAKGAHGKYHETITWAWLTLIHEAMARMSACATSRELLAARPELLDQATLAEVYDVPAMMSDPLARRVFVLPRRRGDRFPGAHQPRDGVVAEIASP